MSNIVSDEKILCFNCDKAYYQKVIEDFVFTNKKPGKDTKKEVSIVLLVQKTTSGIDNQ